MADSHTVIPKIVVEHNTLLINGRMVPHRFPRSRTQVDESSVGRFFNRAVRLSRDYSSTGWRIGKDFSSKQAAKVARLVRQTTSSSVVASSRRIFARESGN